jgi:large subunit ribosomal protein L6
MSRIGRKPVDVPAGVTVQSDGRSVSAKGPKGELTLTLPEGIRASVAGTRVEVSSASDTKEGRSLHGLSRSLVANMITGVSQGYSRELELEGVGFRAAVQGDKLTLLLGFSSPVEYGAPPGVKFSVKENVITVSGADKKLIGDVAAHIRSFYPPEPYKGKGVRYRGEYVRRKTGKTVA